MDGTPWETAFSDKVAKQSWRLFKDTFLRAKELSIPICKKSRKKGKRPACLSEDLVVGLKYKKEMHRQWKHGHIPWDAAWMWKHRIWKAKTQLELNLTRDAKNKRGFHRYIGQKRKTEEKVPL